MSTFVKLKESGLTFNIDQIAYIEEDGDVVTVFFAVTDPTPTLSPGGQPLVVYLDGPDAVSFMACINRRAESW